MCGGEEEEEEDGEAVVMWEHRVGCGGDAEGPVPVPFVRSPSLVPCREGEVIS